jgi:phosphomannomutase
MTGGLNDEDHRALSKVGGMALMVSISGVRGIIGQTLTPTVALEFAQAYGETLGPERVVLGRDSRPSGPMFEAAAAAGLMAAGCHVTRLGLVMTPAVGRAIRDGQFAGGIVITASHNPEEWNGIKFLDNFGVAPDPGRMKRITEVRSASPRSQPTRLGAEVLDSQAGSRHVAAVLAAREVELAALKGLRVVLDSVNGAGCLHTPALLQALGCEVIHINGEPTGHFAHRPEPVRENLDELCAAVRQARAAVGFAQDPDADRLAIVDERGAYIGEEYTLALATRFVLSRRPGPAAANLSTSRLIDHVAARFRVPVVRTPVGESHVARAMLANQCVIGGEGNGGVIDPRVCYVRDSLSAMSLVLQLLAVTGKSVSQLVDELPRYAMIKQKYELPRERIKHAVEAVTRAFGDLQPNTADGLRVEFPDGWVHVRASNTEPILRIIAEAENEAHTNALIARVRAAAGL